MLNKVLRAVAQIPLKREIRLVLYPFHKPLHESERCHSELHYISLLFTMSIVLQTHTYVDDGSHPIRNKLKGKGMLAAKQASGSSDTPRHSTPRLYGPIPEQIRRPYYRRC